MVIREIRNIPLPINRLPPEILAEVLQYRENEIGLVAATHVCRYWRSCLSSTPSLWTNFCSKNFDLARVYLERCKSAPISIRIPITSDPSLFKHIVHTAARVGSVCLHGPYYVVIQWLLDIDKPLLSLRSLELSVSPVLPSDGAQTLPSGFLALQAIFLRSLVLRGLYLPTHVPLPNLSILILQPYKSTVPLRLSSVFASLSQAQNLRELHLFIRECPFSINSEVVTLGHLEHFRLVVDGTSPIHTLSLLRLPRLRSLTLRVAPYMNSPNFTLANCLPPNCCLSLMDVDQMLYEVNTVAPSSRVVTFSTQSLTVAVSVYPNARGTIHDLAFKGWLSDTSPVSLARIKLAEISGLPDLGEIPFTAFEDLEVLRLRGSGHIGTLVALSPRSANGFVPCPRLRTLDVRWEYDLDALELLHLVNLARERMAEGNPFDDVCVGGAVVYQSSLFEELRGYVGNLDLSRVVEEAEGS